jgi:hypothetical protein
MGFGCDPKAIVLGAGAYLFADHTLIESILGNNCDGVDQLMRKNLYLVMSFEQS